jgi:hypothetical protein
VKAIHLAAVLATTLGCGAGTPDAGVKRVTLTGNYLQGIRGQGWNLAAGQIAASLADADFSLFMTVVIQLAPEQEGVGFCERSPPAGATRFARVEDVAGDPASCTSWGGAVLGGNSPSVAEGFAGAGFLVRDRNRAPVARLMIVSASIVEANVTVTFDLLRL